MAKSNFFVHWFPAMLVISFILMTLAVLAPSVSNQIVEQILQYISLGLIAHFILTAYRKEKSLVVPRRKFWLIALGSLLLSCIGSIFETLRFFQPDIPIPAVSSLILFSFSHYVFLYAIFYRIITKRTLGQHVLALVDATIIVVFIGLVVFHVLNELTNPGLQTVPFAIIVITNTSLGLFVFFYFVFIQETHWVSRMALLLLFLSIFIRGIYEISSVYFPDFSMSHLTFLPILIRLAQSAAILWHIDHIEEGTARTTVIPRSWLPLLAIPLFIHYMVEQEGGKLDIFIILFLLIIRQILIARQHGLIVQQLHARNAQLASRIEHRKQQIQESEQQVIPLFLGHPDPMIRLDQSGTALYANLAAQRLFHLPDMTIEHIPRTMRQMLRTLETDAREYEDEQQRQYEIIDIPIHIASHSMGRFTILHDVTDRKARQKRIEYHAYHDALTSIGNRRSLERDFTDRLHEMNYLALVDLDGFKQVNDTYGHEAGDYVLIEVAKRLDEYSNASGSVYRLGGDEFAILLAADDELSLRRICKSLLQYLRRPYVYKGQSLLVSASIGVTACDQSDLETCLKQADLAMYRIKHRDKNDVALYRSDL